MGFNKDDEKRLKSASGGLATVLFYLHYLKKILLIKSLLLESVGDNHRMFDFKILSNPDEVYSCAGSAYYPIEISRVIKKILKEKEENTYAIIALPCVVYSLRLAIERNPNT